MADMSTARFENVRRLEAWGGETRVNSVRLAALVAFYAQHVARYHLGGDGAPTAAFHAIATALTMLWATEILIVHFFLTRRFMPGWLKYAATGLDLALVTALLAAASGPSSPLIVLYFLIVAASPLRFDLPHVRFATLGAMAGYLVVLGHAKWFRPEFHVDRQTQVIVLLGLGAAGILAGQMLRQVGRLMTRPDVIVVDDAEGEG